ncbi:hypothetical protein EX30DRAFT_357185 [Ascodesmis nigricans]|uniref:CNH domain-containing protein n=1 Tax=Ascodesmis nigricans TaxID=341454 RepID=A0A4S2N7K3_9PEZI|nr:hypothetical protein EX30DRAFT_357185 [Ascodesmis nigricans]
MLNAFQARSILEFGPKDRIQIHAILAYGDKLLLGLSTGALRIYRVDAPETADSTNVSLSSIRTIDGFSKGRIDLLLCIKEAGILVVLAGGNVHIHDLTDFSHTETLNKAKGASTLAVTSNIERDPETEIPEIVSRLAVGVKKRLLLYSWHDGGFQEGKEVTLAGNVRTLTWASERRVVVGMQGGFVVVDVHTGAAEEIVPPEDTVGAGGKAGEGGGWASYVGMGGWGSRSLSTRLGDELLLLKDSTTLFVDSEGQPIPNRPPISWSSPPDSIAYSYPYLISLHAAKHHLEVRNPATRTLLQTIQLPTVTTLHVPPPNVSLMHAGKLFFVASPTQVWRMCATDYETQINELVENNHLDEAIKLIESLENVLLKERKDERLREVQMLKAQRLFEKKKYDQSMALFGEVSAPPERVVRLFPRSIAGDLSIWPDEYDREEDGEVVPEPEEDGGETPAEPTPNVEEESGEAPEEQKDAEETTKEVTIESADKTADSIAESPPSKPTLARVNTAPTPDLKKMNGSPAEPSYLKSVATSRNLGDTASIFSFGARRRHVAPMDTESLPTIDETPKPLEGDDLKRAATELAGLYLNEVRRKLTKYFTRDGDPIDPAKVLSTPNFEASRKDPLEASFLVVENASSLSAHELEQARIEKVQATCRAIDTALFRVYVLYRPTMVGSLVRLQNHIDPEVVSQKLREQRKFEDLVDFLEKKGLHREALELLRFFANSEVHESATDSGEEEEEGSIPSALRGWSRTITYLTRLKPEHIDLILEFSPLPLKHSPKEAMEIFIGDTGNSSLLPRPAVLNFLESTSPFLAIEYLEHIINTLFDTTPEFHTRLVRLYLNILSTSPTPDPTWHTKLIAFLTTSSQYRFERVLSWLPRDTPTFFEPRAIVLSKLGRHKAALEIYVFRLKDYTKAESYCVTQHLANPPDKLVDSVFHILLSLYLEPPVEYDTRDEFDRRQLLEQALTVLSHHGVRLDPSESLKLVPEKVQMVKLVGYFEKRMRAAREEVATGMVRRGLEEVRRGEVRERLMVGKEGRARSCVVKEESACGVCHKRLGGSVLVWLPSGQLVHYGCQSGQKKGF